MFCNDIITLRKTCRRIFCVIEKSCILSEAGQLWTTVQGSFRHRRIPSQSRITLASCRLILSPSQLNGQLEVRGSPVPYLRGLLSQDWASPHFKTTHLRVLICIALGLPENLLCTMHCAWSGESFLRPLPTAYKGLCEGSCKGIRDRAAVHCINHACMGSVTFCPTQVLKVAFLHCPTSWLNKFVLRDSTDTPVSAVAIKRERSRACKGTCLSERSSIIYK